MKTNIQSTKQFKNMTVFYKNIYLHIIFFLNISGQIIHSLKNSKISISRPQSEPPKPLLTQANNNNNNNNNKSGK